MQSCTMSTTVLKVIISAPVLLVIVLWTLVFIGSRTSDDHHRTPRDIMNYDETEETSATLGTPELQSLTSLYENWNRDVLSVDQLHGAGMDAYDRDYRFLKEFKARNLFHASVLTDESRLNDYGTAIRLTWGGDVSALHFFFGVTDTERVKRHQVAETVQLTDVNIGDVYGTQHILQSMTHLCSKLTDEYHWFIVVKDDAYVNVPTIAKVLDRLTPSTEIAISIHSGKCSVDGGLILSQRLLTSMCPRLWECTAAPETPDTDADLTSCMAHIVQRTCTSSKEISELFHTNASSENSLSAGHLAGEIGFLYPVSPVDLFYDIHIHYTEQRLHQAEQHIQKLEDEIKAASQDNRPYSDEITPQRRQKTSYKSNELDQVAIFDSIHKFINSTDEFYQYIDDSGKVYLDTCKLEKEDLTVDGSVYGDILKMAEKSVGSKAGNMENFAYRLVKPNVGIEYQFFFVEHRRTKSIKSPDDKIYQVTILQPYDKFEIVTKEVHTVNTVSLVVVVREEKDIENAMRYLSHACVNDTTTNVECQVIILIQDLETRETAVSKVKALNVHMIRTGRNIIDLQNSFDLVKGYIRDNSVIAFINSNLILTKSFIHRCILNSNSGQKAYFPVHFQLLSEISPGNDMTNYYISNDNGFWANAEYDTFCAHTDDIKQIDALPSTTEELMDDLRVRKVEIVRSAEPGLMKFWTKEVCSRESSARKENCEEHYRYVNLR